MSIVIDGTGTISGVSATGLTTAQTVGYSSLPTGSVLQVVSANIATSASTSSTSPTSTGLSVSITPKFTTSKIFMIANATVGHSAANLQQFAFARNTTVINNANNGSGGVFAITSSSVGNPSQMGYPWGMNYLDSPSTTSATTYSVYFWTDSGTVYFNTRGSNSPLGNGTITLMEIAG